MASSLRRRSGNRTKPPQQGAELSEALRRWFRKHGRTLPWRETRDPYRVLVSEFMLQQTQVSRVLEYYERFLTRFPTVHDLAAAPASRVLESWSGLGYYARARNLHAIAGLVTRDGGDIPAHPEQLRQLPGVGAYTAGAVASFAFEQSAALVDTNVARVLQRIFAPHLSPKRDLKRLWDIAESILPVRGKTAWAHNQALMELGALICTARVRHCARCPVSGLCKTRQRELRPRKKPARQPKAGAPKRTKASDN